MDELIVLYGYRVAETKYKNPTEVLPDLSLRMRLFDNATDTGRNPVRTSLGCHFIGAALPVPDNQHHLSQMEAIPKRVGRRMDQIDRARLRRLKRFTMRFLEDEFAGEQFPSDHDFDFEKWITGAPYTQQKKALFRKEHERELDRDKDFDVDGHTKDEPYEKYNAFRGIHARKNAYKVRVGPFFHDLSEIVFKKKYFAKKVPVDIRPQFLLDRLNEYTRTMFTDYSSFEAWFTREVIAIERCVYSWFLKYHPKHDYYMDLFNRGIFGRNKINYKKFTVSIWCKRMSGEMNTSLGNGLMNLIASFFILHENGFTCYDGVFEGDDAAIKFESEKYASLPDPTSEDYRDIGANIKIERPHKANLGSFCGLVYDEYAKQNVTDPLFCLINFGYTTAQYLRATKNKKMALLRSKSYSYLYEHPACPVVKALALYGLRMTDKIDNRYMLSVIKKQKLSVYERDKMDNIVDYINLDKFDQNVHEEIDFSTRLVVQDVYKLSIEHQLIIEDYLNKKQDLSPIDIPSIVHLFNDDQREYYRNYNRLVNKANLGDFQSFENRKYEIYLTPNEITYL